MGLAAGGGFLICGLGEQLKSDEMRVKKETLGSLNGNEGFFGRGQIKKKTSQNPLEYTTNQIAALHCEAKIQISYMLLVVPTHPYLLPRMLSIHTKHIIP